MLKYSSDSAFYARAEHPVVPSYLVVPVVEILEPGTTSTETREDAAVVLHEGATVSNNLRINSIHEGVVFESVNSSIAVVDADGNVECVTDGRARIIAKLGPNRQLLKGNVSIVNPTEATTLQEWVTGSFARFSEDQVVNMLDGVTASPATRSLFVDDERNPDLFCLEYVEALTAVAVTNSRYGSSIGLTAITPRHIVGCKHAPMVNGDTATWRDSSSDTYTRTITQQIALEGDTIIYFLDSDLPPGINPVHLLPADVSAYLRNTNLGVPLLFVDKDNIVSVADSVGELSSGFAGAWYPASLPRREFYTRPVPGTSGKPILIPWSGSGLALWGTFHVDIGGPAYHAKDWPPILNALDVAAGVSSRTNLLLWSNDFAQTSWVKDSHNGAGSVRAFGDIVEFEVAVTPGPYFGLLRQLLSIPGGMVTLSCWMRAGTMTQVNLTMNDGVSGNFATVCNLTSEWQKFTLTYNNVTGGGYFGIGADGYAGQSMTGGSIFVRDCQLEVGSVATPYIPTFGTSATSANTGHLPRRADLSAFNFYGAEHPLAAIPDQVFRIETWQPELFQNLVSLPPSNDQEVKMLIDPFSDYGARSNILGARGVWKTGQLNGHAALLLDASDDGYITDRVLGAAYTIYGVAKTSAGGLRRTINSANLNSLISTSRINNAVYTSGDIVFSMSAYADQWCIFVLRVSGVAGETSFRLNGVELANPGSAYASWGQLAIGAVAWSFNEPAGGYIVSVGAFSRAIDGTELGILEDYLSQKTGIPLA